MPNSALILGSTVFPGTATAGTLLGGTDPRSLEEEQADNAGFTVTVVPDATWSAMTAADFAQYQLIIIGDPDCNSGVYPSYATALANASVWEPVVMASGGNKYLVGTDPEDHNKDGDGGAQSTFLGGPGGAAKLVKAGIIFAGAVAGATGAYVDLSCTTSPPGTPLPLMDGLSTFGPGQFTQGGAPCAGSISLVANFPGLVGALTDADLSGWECSVHEFIDKWPGDWVPLALATDSTVPQVYTATDIDSASGALVSGAPYLLISGAGISITSGITLSPATATNPVGGSQTVTATVTQTSGGVTTPVAGATVTFAISAGPNVGTTGTCVTDATGQCTFTYSDTGGTGTDSMIATTTVAGLVESGTATEIWVATSTTGCAAFPCVPGSGPDLARSDCYVELGVEGISPSEVRSGRVVLCHDGDSCDTDGTINDVCTFKVAVCIDQSNLSACHPPTGLQALHVSSKLPAAAVPSSLTGSACGNFVDVPVKLHHGAHNSKGTGMLLLQANATAVTGTTPRADRDTYVLECLP